MFDWLVPCLFPTCTDLTNIRPTQSIIYVPLQVNRFHRSIVLIVQYKYLKPVPGDFILQNLIFRARSCGTCFISQSVRPGASGLPYYCVPLVCVSAVMDSLAVWWHNKPKNKNQKSSFGFHFDVTTMVCCFVLLTRGWGRLETRPPVPLGSSPELCAFIMSLAPPVHGHWKCFVPP